MERTKLTLVIAAAALAAAACSSGGGTTAGTTATHAPAAHASKSAAGPASPASSAPAAAAGALTGKWSGQYSGSYQGTFVLHWRQSGSKLGGTIAISNPPSTLAIHGSVTGGTIKFGTVGSLAITYTGTVSGSSMSGTYHVGNASGGPWSSSRS